MSLLRRSERGFTMVEVVIALFAVAALVVLGCWLAGWCSGTKCSTPAPTAAAVPVAPAPATAAQPVPDPVNPVNADGTLVYVTCADGTCSGPLSEFYYRYGRTHTITPIGPYDWRGTTSGYYLLVRPCPPADTKTP